MAQATSRVDLVERSLIHLTNVGTWVKHREHPGRGSRVFRTFEPSVEVLGFFRRVQFAKKRRYLDLGGTYPLLCERLANYCVVKEWISGHTVCVGGSDLCREVPLSPELEKRVVMYMETNCSLRE